MTRTNGTPTLEQPLPPAPAPPPTPPAPPTPDDAPTPVRTPRPRPAGAPDDPDADDEDAPPIAPLGEIQLRDYEQLVLRVHLLERYVVRLEGALAGRRGGP